MTDPSVDTVLTAARPAFTPDEARQLARDLFGVDGAATEADSERDQAFLIDGERPAVMKISNAAESTDQLDMEALAAQTHRPRGPQPAGRLAMGRAGCPAHVPRANRA